MERHSKPIEYNHLLSKAKLDHIKHITPRGSDSSGLLSPSPKTSFGFYDSRE